MDSMKLRRELLSWLESHEMGIHEDKRSDYTFDSNACLGGGPIKFTQTLGFDIISHTLQPPFG
jgi:hypothetical protein